ncbi:MAG TPA: hypothetical protein VFE14_01335 [Micromonosporaceae bacterium]|nr:hypothetical protein [Micromonosporaceae bacterium]
MRTLTVIDEAGQMRATRGLAAVLLAGCTAVLGVAGCDSLDNAQRTGDRADLANDLATRLGRAESLSYTAEYQLAAGATAIVAQARNPSRVAYTYPGGKLILATLAVWDCRAAGSADTCTVAAVPAQTAAPVPPPDTLGVLAGHGIVIAPVVVGLLNAAALDSDAALAQRDTTIAGLHATCVRAEGVDNAAASTFEVCVTTDGVIGSFTGIVNGNPVELAMAAYRGSVAADAFDPPAGATIVDTRGGKP